MLSIKSMLILSLLLAFMFSMVPLPVFAAAQKIKQVKVENRADAVVITVHASKPIFMASTKTGGRYLAFDVQGTMHSGRKTVKISSGGINGVTYGWFKQDPPTIRIVVSMNSLKPYNVSFASDKHEMTIKVAKNVVAAKKTSPAPIAKKTVASAPQKFSTTVSAAEIEAQLAASDTQRPAIKVVGNQVTIEPAVGIASQPVLVASAKPAAVQVARGSVSGNSPKVALDFVGTDIHDVLKALAMQTGENIVASSDVKGDVTVSLSGVTVEEALKLISSISGYKYAKVDGIYMVGSKEHIDAVSSSSEAAVDTGTTSVAVTVKYADPDFVMKTLETRFGMVQVVSSEPVAKEKGPKGPVVLVLSGQAANVRAAKTMIESIESSLADRASELVTEFVEVRYVDISEMANFLMGSIPGLTVKMGPNNGFNQKCANPVEMVSSGSGGGGGGYSSGTANAPAPPKLLILEGSSAEIARAKDLLAKLDVQQPQIMLEAKVVDLTNDAGKELGIDWNWSDVRVEEQDRDPVGELDALLGPISEVHLGRFTRTPLQFLSKIKALTESGKARILANPNVMAMDGKPASIFIGDEVKYVVNIQQTPTGINVTVETATVGIQLHSIAKINSDGYITMNLHPEVSVITRWVDTPAGLTLPEISRRFVDSTVRVKDGETIVIGGLIREEERETMSGIPILKDLPIIGNFFKTKNKSKNRSEIMMFITPRVISGG